MKPICVTCRCFYRPKRNGIAFVEGMPRGSEYGTTAEERRGNRAPHFWKPYKLWIGDLWECPDCHHQLISGVAHLPVAEHYQPEFASGIAVLGAEIQINDC